MGQGQGRVCVAVELAEKDIEMKIVKKVSSEWIKEKNCEIVDPNGWDRKNYDYSFNKEKITHEEFERRLMLSTIQCDGELCVLRRQNENL